MGQASNQRTQRRLAALRAEFANWKVDYILIGGASNRRWLSGFTGSTGWLLVGERTAVLGTDFRYWDQAARQAPEFALRDFRSGTPAAWTRFLAFDEPVRLGIEARHLTLAQLKEFRDVENVAIVELESSLEYFRQVKSDEEIAIIREAAAITDAAMADVNQMAYIGQEEKELAWRLESQMRERGATAMAFPPIVAFGENAAMAHHQPGERALRAGDPIIVDMGAELNGYASDLTRSFYAGPDPSAKYREVYDLVERAQKVALEGIRADVSGKEADTLARNTIASAGYGEAFGHSLGHGLGLDVHEGPSLSQLHGAAPLPEGAVVTVEPGIYLPDWGGVRIEDLIRVTDRGVELISHCPKSPAIDI